LEPDWLSSLSRVRVEGVAGIVFSVGALLVLQDQSRLQPWFIEYLLLLAAVTFSGKEKAALNTCCLILSTVYFWSGVHKMNTSFMTNVFPVLVSPFVNSGTSSAIRYIGALIPFVEAGFAFALLPERVVMV
jgi:hypothetical protein